MKFIICIVCMLLSLVVSAIDIPREKRYPPYPNVWGVELQHQCFKDYKCSLLCNAMQDNDLWFTYEHYNYSSDAFHLRSVHKFFANSTMGISRDEQDDIYRVHQPKHFRCAQHSNCGYKVTLNNGDTIETPKYSIFPEHKVFEVSNLIKKNAQSEVIGTYSVIFVHEYQHEFILFQSLEKYASHEEHKLPLRTSTFSYSAWPYKETSFKFQLQPISSRVEGLEDGTFLLWSTRDGNGIILRFDENLKTKFRTGPVKLSDGRVLKSKFFVVDYSALQKIFSEVEESNTTTPIQTTHDRIADYLYENQDKLIKEMSK